MSIPPIFPFLPSYSRFTRGELTSGVLLKGTAHCYRDTATHFYVRVRFTQICPNSKYLPYICSKSPKSHSFVKFYLILFSAKIGMKLGINHHIVGLVHKIHIINDLYVEARPANVSEYHAARKVEFQPFNRSYSQLMFLSFF